MASRVGVPVPPLPPLEAPATVIASSSTTSSSDVLSTLPRWARIAIGAAAVGAVAFVGYRLLSKTPTQSNTVAKAKPGASAAAPAAPTSAASAAASAAAKPAEKPKATTPSSSAPASASDGAAPASAAAVPESSALKDAMEFKKRGNDAYKNKNYKEAINYYTKALEIIPESDEERSVFFCNRAACHLFLDNVDEVIADCSSAIALKPKYVKAFNRRAQAYEKQGNLRKALYDYTAVCFIERFTNDGAQKAAERVLAQLGKEGVVEHLKTKTPSLPSSSLIRMYFDGYKKPSVPEESLESLNEKITANPEDALALHQRALVHFHARDFAACFADCGAAQPKLKETAGESAALKSAFLVNSSLLASFSLLRGETDAAVTYADAGLAVDPYYTELIVKRATAKVEKGIIDEAMKDFESAISLNKKDPDAYYQRGQVYALIQSIDKAMDDFQKAVDLKSAPYPAYVQLGVMQVSVQNVGDAVKTFDAATKRFPQESNVFAYYGEVLMALQQFDQAEEMFDKASKLDPKNATPLMHKGWLVLQSKADVVSAVTLLNEAIQADPKSDQVYNRLAAILIQQGLFDKAIECYDKAIENNHNVQDLANTISCREAALAQKQVMLDLPSIIPDGVVVPRE